MTQKLKKSRRIETAHAVSTAALAAKLPWMVEMLPPSQPEASEAQCASTHNEAQIDLLANSLSHFGFIRPVVIDDRERIVAGHGIWMAAKKLGLKLIPVIRVSHLSETQLRAYALADNQLATKSGWDRELLSLEFGDLQIALPEIGLDLTMLGFDAGEIDSSLEDFGEGAADPADESLRLSDGPAVSQPGDVFVLGRHRLLVGDARDPDAYERLMQGEVAEMGIHDLPYNVRIQGNVGGRGRIKRREFACASGEMDPEQFTAFLKDTLGLCAHHSRRRRHPLRVHRLAACRRADRCRQRGVRRPQEYVRLGQE